MKDLTATISFKDQMKSNFAEEKFQISAKSFCTTLPYLKSASNSYYFLD